MKLKYILIIVAVILGGWYLYSINGGQGGSTSFSARACDTNTQALSSVGTTSRTILAAYSNRAYVRIQQPINASSSIALSFDEGASATAGNGLILTAATTTIQNTFVEFGLSTDFPYVGAVTAIVEATEATLLVAGNASTTVIVTECRW